MKKIKVRNVLIGIAVAVGLTGGIVATTVHCDEFVDTLADKLGYEKVIEEEKTEGTETDVENSETDSTD